jgi:hypothetical protein
MPHARLSDPQTSQDAAKSVKNITATQRTIHNLLINSMTDEELYVSYSKAVIAGLAPMASPSGVRSRRAELVVLGLVEDTGTRRKLVSGRKAIVWKQTRNV